LNIKKPALPEATVKSLAEMKDLKNELYGVFVRMLFLFSPESFENNFV
jgi:hypothetical protein